MNRRRHSDRVGRVFILINACMMVIVGPSLLHGGVVRADVRPTLPQSQLVAPSLPKLDLGLCEAVDAANALRERAAKLLQLQITIAGSLTDLTAVSAANADFDVKSAISEIEKNKGTPSASPTKEAASKAAAAVFATAKAASQHAFTLLQDKLQNKTICTEGSECLTDLHNRCSDWAKGAREEAAVLPGVGAGWQTVFLQGLASFLADRAQQELMLWLMTQVEQRICEDEVAKRWFTNTCTLSSTNPGGAQVPSTIFAAAVRKDLEELPVKVAYTALVPLYPDEKTAHAELWPALEILLLLVEEVKHGKPPIAMLASLASDAARLSPICKDRPESVACRVALVGTVAKFLGDAVEPIGTVDFSDTTQVCGLASTLLMDADFKKALTDLAPDPDKQKALVKVSPILSVALVGPILNFNVCDTTTSLPDALKHVETQYNVTIDRSGIDTRVDKLKAVFAAALDLQSVIKGFKAQTFGATADAVTRIADAAEMTRLTVKLFSSIADLFEQPQLKKIVDTLGAVLDSVFEISQGRYADGIRDLVIVIQPYSERLPEAFRQFVPLMADLAAAKDAKDVQAALEAAAAPVGSWRYKRTKPFTISVGSLVGLSGGGEFPWHQGVDAFQSSGFAGGAMATLGIDVAWRASDTHTVGVYLSMLDLGQLAYARISGQVTGGDNGGKVTADTQSDVGLLDVLSPGVYFRWGVGNSPFSVGCGPSIAPRLRHYLVTSATGATSDDRLLTTVRFNLFLAIDLTLFPVY